MTRGECRACGKGQPPDLLLFGMCRGCNRAFWRGAMGGWLVAWIATAGLLLWAFL